METEGLPKQNVDTYPPLGYGYIRKAEQTSWFCLLNAPCQRYWEWNSPDFDRHLVEQVPRFTARAQIRMRDLGLTLMLHGAASIDGRLVRKDFHTARFAERNDSFISRICYYFLMPISCFTRLHIRCSKSVWRLSAAIPSLSHYAGNS